MESEPTGKRFSISTIVDMAMIPNDGTRDRMIQSLPFALREIERFLAEVPDIAAETKAKMPWYASWIPLSWIEAALRSSLRSRVSKIDWRDDNDNVMGIVVKHGNDEIYRRRFNEQQT